MELTQLKYRMDSRAEGLKDSLEHSQFLAAEMVQWWGQREKKKKIEFVTFLLGLSWDSCIPPNTLYGVNFFFFFYLVGHEINF